MLDQQSSQLTEIAGDMVREVVGRLKTDYQVDGKDITPTQLLERLGFRREQLASRVGELSGGQRRRLQLMLTLLEEPNVLVLDEPTNDVDIDMLSATEDLLDSWPGTLIVVSHDRYLLERVTDQQYAILDGHLRHLPGGIDEYLRIKARREVSGGGASPPQAAQPPTQALSGAELRSVEKKEIASLDRALAKLSDRVNAKHVELAEHDQSDHVGLGKLTQQLRELEPRWPRRRTAGWSCPSWSTSARSGSYNVGHALLGAAAARLGPVLAATGRAIPARCAGSPRRHRVGRLGRL